jgi:hypothetical protein
MPPGAVKWLRYSEIGVLGAGLRAVDSRPMSFLLLPYCCHVASLFDRGIAQHLQATVTEEPSSVSWQYGSPYPVMVSDSGPDEGYWVRPQIAAAPVCPPAYLWCLSVKDRFGANIIVTTILPDLVTGSRCQGPMPPLSDPDRPCERSRRVPPANGPCGRGARPTAPMLDRDARGSARRQRPDRCRPTRTRNARPPTAPFIVIALRTVTAVLEEALRVPGADRIECPAYGFHQRPSGTSSHLP